MSCGGRFPVFVPFEPLPDPRKPEFPYVRGLNLSIRRHVPPPPFGVTGYVKGAERQESPPEPIRAVTQSEWCLRQPPADTPPHSDSSLHNLYIIDQLVCNDGRGAQVVRCRLDQNEDKVYVAKIYDALYYAYSHRSYGTPVDVTWLADQHYTREAAAFEDLQEAGADGLLVPTYYGPWTFDMGLKGSPEVRSVRMILTEYIQGVTMYSFVENNQVHYIPPQQRLDILARAMEVESKIMFYGVKHNDFAMRNVMLAGSNIETQIPRIVLIDLNHSTAIQRPNCRYRGGFFHTTLPVNPVYRNWGPCLNAFLEWVPQPHRSRPAAFKGWMKSVWGGSKEFASREEGVRPMNYDEAVEMVPPWPDSKVEDPSRIPIVFLKKQKRQPQPPPPFVRLSRRHVDPDGEL